MFLISIQISSIRLLTSTNQALYKVTGKIKSHKWERKFAAKAQNTEYTNRNQQTHFENVSTLFSRYECFACMYAYCNPCIPSGYRGQTTILDPLEMEWTDGSYLPCGLWVSNLDLLQAW